MSAKRFDRTFHPLDPPSGGRDRAVFEVVPTPGLLSIAFGLFALRRGARHTPPTH